MRHGEKWKANRAEEKLDSFLSNHQSNDMTLSGQSRCPASSDVNKVATGANQF